MLMRESTPNKHQLMSSLVSPSLPAHILKIPDHLDKDQAELSISTI